MSKTYKFLLTFICFLLIASVVLGIAYLFYDKDVSESTIVLVDGNLSINFLDGNVIKNKDEDSYEMNFSVTNNGSVAASYSINIADVKNNEEDVEVVITNKSLSSVVLESKLPIEDSMLIDGIQIASGETHNYSVNISSNSKIFSGVIKVNEEKPKITTFAQTLLESNAVSNTTLTNVGEAVATMDEGLISDIDDTGSTYYFRGAVTNNYVNFADLTWRIVRINGDGSVKLILDTAIDTVQAFYTSNEEEEFYMYDYSSIKEYLESWYEYYLQNYDEYISLDKFCNDYTMNDNATYSSYIRNVTNKIPTFNCLGKNVGAKIGLITADEVIYAGGLYKENNTSYYLYNDKITSGWWTMTPASGNETSMNPFIVNESGMLNNDVVGTYNRGVRPVISLTKNISVSGSGTASDPYIINYEN